MIYKCKNCGKTYNCKQDYCECGNNIFISINVKNDTNSGFAGSDMQKKFYNSTSGQRKQYKTLLVLSISVFLVSIIFTIFLLYKAFTIPAKTKNTVKNPTIVNNLDNIPDINTFWLESTNDTNSVVKDNNVNPVIKIVNTEINPTPFKSQVKKTKISTTKNSQTDNKKNENRKNIKSNIGNNDNKKNLDVIEQKFEQNNDNVLNQQKENKKLDFLPENNEELSKYKNSLRQQLFSFFPILSVKGSGSAQIAFNISPEGKLLNRRFLVQSDNKSLNDALYHMLMRLPSYNPPPKGYNGEDIILLMEFNNGYYSFSYK